MLAIVTHSLMEIDDVDLRLVPLGEKYAWLELATGKLHGKLYTSIRQAVNGLRRYYSEPFKVVFRPEPNDPGYNRQSSRLKSSTQNPRKMHPIAA